MKICVLIPVYMTDNSRDINLKNLRKLKETEFKYVDEVVICDQCFQQSDYIEGFTYLGPFGKMPNGCLDARNILFRWFYNSDYDYALLMDARENISKSGMNAFVTLCNKIHNNEVDMDCIQSTLGIMISAERMDDKQRKDYKDNLWIRPSKPQNHLHHCFLANLRKKYNLELYIEPEIIYAENFKVTDDLYFITKLSRYIDMWICGEMTVNTGPQSASLWATSKGSESTRGIPWKKTLNAVLDKHCHCDIFGDYKTRPVVPVIFQRDETYKDCLTDYKPRKKKNEDTNI